MEPIIDFNEKHNIVEYNGEEYIHCRNCNKQLMSIMKLNEDPFPIKNGKETIYVSHRRVQCSCPYCKDKSWIIKAKGLVLFAPIIDKTYILGIELGDPKDKDGILFNFRLGKI